MCGEVRVRVKVAELLVGMGSVVCGGFGGGGSGKYDEWWDFWGGGAERVPRNIR